MADTGIQMPGGFGGLMRYSDEYDSIFMLKPTHVVMFIIFIIGLRILFPFIF